MNIKLAVFLTILISSSGALGSTCQFPKASKSTSVFQNPGNKTMWLATEERSKAIFQYLGFKPIELANLNSKTKIVNLTACTKKNDFIYMYIKPGLPFVMTSSNVCEDKVIKSLELSLFVPSGFGSMEAPGELVSIQELLICTERG